MDRIRVPQVVRHLGQPAASPRLTVGVYGIPLLVAALMAPPMAAAQGRLKPISEGDGLVHGAPVLPVSAMDLHPGQVQSINLRPRATSLLEFPYAVAEVHAGDPDVLTASVRAGKVILKAARDTIAETNVLVLLGDAELTAIAFRVRVDSTQPQVDIVRFTDPVGKHLNEAEAEIARRVRADEDRRVNELTRERVLQQLLLAGNVVRIDRKAMAGSDRDRFGIDIESVQSLPGEDGRPRLYLRYRVLNGTIAPLADLAIVARIESPQRKWVVFEHRATRELADLRDIRATSVIPAGGSAYGLLILDPLQLEQHESLSIEAIGFNNQRHVKVDGVFVGGKK